MYISIFIHVYVCKRIYIRRAEGMFGPAYAHHMKIRKCQVYSHFEYQIEKRADFWKNSSMVYSGIQVLSLFGPSYAHQMQIRKSQLYSYLA